AKADAIIVTGTRRETTIQDATINLQAISAEELQAKNIEDIRDLAAFTPGMSVPDTGPRSTGQVILRGLTADSLGSFGANFDDSLAVYLGETPLYQDLKFIDINRVETLLGPQGTLYGRGTLSGAIRYIPNRPEAGELDFGVRSSVYDVAHGGSVGYTGEGFVNIPVLGDKVALRSVVGYYSDPGFIDYPFLVREPGVSDPQPGTGYDLGTPEEIEANLYREKDVNFEKTFTTRNVIGIYPTEWLTAYLTYAHQETETDGRQANGDGIFGSGKYEGPWRYLEPSDRTSDLYSVEVEADIFGFAKMVSATAWTKQEAKSSADVTDLLLDLDYDYELFPAFAGFTQSEQKREQFNAELRFVSTHEGPFSWVLGGFYNKMLYDSDYVEILPGMSGFFGVTRPDEIEYASYVDSKDEEAAVFGEVSIEVLPGL
ncbi:MAG: TonB-dependent receptor plug domain-containing protein, partial [Oricola sp.]|nr:TonB-dependent receptor plug domain-containing protein [Oricola sp.]